MKVLDLFSGIGGFSLGLHRAGMETVAFCEFDKKAQLVLKKHWPGIPIYEDVKTLSRKTLDEKGVGKIDLVCGGFPCQPFSVAGKKRGTEDDRDLWPEMFRVIREVKPTWVIGENVNGFINMALDRTESDLESEGYEVQSFVIPACSVDAKHKRERVWIVAHNEKQSDSEHNGKPKERQIQKFRESIGGSNVGNSAKQGPQDWGRPSLEEHKQVEEFERPSGPHSGISHAANSIGSDSGRGSVIGDSNYEGGSACRAREKGLQPQDGEACSDNIEQSGSAFSDSDCWGWSLRWDRKLSTTSQVKRYRENNRRRAEEYEPGKRWEIEPGVGRVANGVSGRVDRLKQLGNAVVPQVVEIIGRAIMISDYDCG